MKLNQKLVRLVRFAGVGALLLASSANAVIINSSGVWTSTTGGATNIDGLNTSTLSFSSGSAQSSYNFTGVTNSDIGAIGDGTSFLIGKFTHNNIAIDPPSITGANLRLDLGFTPPAVPAIGPFNFFFSHNETNNVAGTCPVGSVTVCDDIVTLPGALSTETFTLSGVTYALMLQFVNSANQAVFSFMTKEGYSNTANLRGTFKKVTVPTSVPEPFTLGLIALGLFGIALTNRKVRQNNV